MTLKTKGGTCDMTLDKAVDIIYYPSDLFGNKPSEDDVKKARSVIDEYLKKKREKKKVKKN